nr:T9SS type A sorting domain-containing protein [uncultured Flavobacterium sp.]
MKRNCFGLLSCALLCCMTIQAQNILWEKSYGGKQAEYLLDAQPTADYGFILAGASLSKKSGNKDEENIGDLDFWIWKMDEGGELDWQKNLGGTGPDMLYSIRNTNDGGFILAGTSESAKAYAKQSDALGREDIWVMKLNARGGEEWQCTLGGPGQDLVKAIVPTSDGGYIVGGSSSSPMSLKVRKGDVDPNGKWDESRGGMDAWIVKLDNKGKVVWQRTIGGEYMDMLQSIEPTKDGGFIVGIYTNSPSSVDKSEDGYGQGDYWVLKLDNKGNIEWQKVFGGEQDDRITTVKQSIEGGFIIGGHSASGSTGNKSISNKKGSDFWILKLDEKGEILWQQVYNTGKVDVLTSLLENADGTLLLGGYAQSEVIGQENKKDKQEINDYIAIKTDAKGEELWKKTVGSNGEDKLTKLIETRDGDYLLAGTSSGAMSRDRYTGKGSNDYWVVKLGDKDKKKKQEKRSQIEAIPNPAGQFTNIIVGFDFSSGSASVFDLAGRQLQHFEVTSRTIPLEMSGLPEGIYIVEVKTDKGTDSVKVIKSK